MKSKLARRVLSSVLTLGILLNLLPTAAFAAPGDNSGDLVLNKTATLEDDGTYSIQLEAFSTGETLTVMKQTPTDIVLVLDVSGSMKEQLDNTRIDDGYVPATGKVSDMPTDVYHHCPDGTYSTVKWTDERSWLGNGHIRFTCDHCNVTRSLNYTFGIANPSQIEDQDGWALYKKGSHYAYKLEVLQMAAKQFIQEVAARNAAIDDPDNQHRVSIVKFASEKNDKIGNNFNDSGYNYTQIVDGLTVVNSESAAKLNTDIDSFSAAGATSVDYGMEYAKSILDPVRSADRKQVVIVFTDGAPTHSNSFEGNVANAAIGTAEKLKSSGVSIYTIGVFDNANPDDTTTNTNAYMNAMSSNYPKANSYTDLGQGSNQGYYKVAANTEELNNIFTSISEDVNYSNVTLNANAVIKDIMGDGFTLTAHSAATAYSVPYTGKDANGNRTFGETQTPYTATINDDKTVVSVTGFDYSQKYLVDGDSAQGEKLVVTITGVEATDAAVTNGLVSTNNALSGIYENADSQNPTAVFPQPETQLSSKVYVMDYAKSTELTGIPNSLTHMDSDGMHKFSTAVTSLNMTYGKAAGTSYAPATTLWNGYDDYYIFGQWNTTPEGVTTGNNTWTKVSVLPANNVYYEDTFVTNETTGTVGIVYSADKWKTATTEGANTGDASNDEHGWIASMDNDTTYSDGTAATGTAGATATFSFTGTGVDIYSRTNMETGLVVAKLYKGENTTSAAAMVKSLTVDNLAQSGDYYQIPTASFIGLEYGIYTVKLTVASTSKTTGTERSTYYLDGIRVYNPLSAEREEEDIVQEAYGDEIGASFCSVRDILLDAESLEGKAENVSGAVFIDFNPVTNTEEDTATTMTIKTYEDYGPKNEVYLAKGQAIALNVGTAVSKLSVGLKAPSGATEAQVTNRKNTSTIAINAASDQYYKIAPNADGYVIIKNTGEQLLSVTKLKMSGDGIETTAFSMDVPAMMSYANSFDSLPVVTYSLMDAEADNSGEPEEPEQGDVVVETPEEPEQGDVVVETPEEPTQEKPSSPVSDSWIAELFRAIRNIIWR
ncbi:vWA domain-containing protein [Fusibacillus kribbianus]|uniref:VWA domain-containing protein n=1 Tax=Fusibacillus kribbianus TaxID=3044208 RepID=A0AAP4BAR2_9FIRM|nr:vWA domain-containing protein [Ruminococcus sp. YH-rum2234]MDI9241823.1 vWA domain-containing protein [Ruminococcus sp. YH-rum2234]